MTTELSFEIARSARRRWRLAGYFVGHVTTAGAFGVRCSGAWGDVLVCLPVAFTATAVAWRVGVGWRCHRISCEAKVALGNFRGLIEKSVGVRTDLLCGFFGRDPAFFPITKLGTLTIYRMEENTRTGAVRMRWYEDERMSHGEYLFRRSRRNQMVCFTDEGEQEAEPLHS